MVRGVLRYTYQTAMVPPHRVEPLSCDSRSRTNGLFLEETGLGNTLINVWFIERTPVSSSRSSPCPVQSTSCNQGTITIGNSLVAALYT